MAVLNFFDRQTDRPTDRPTDRQTDRQTDKAGYRSSLPELKNGGNHIRKALDSPQESSSL